MGRDAGLNNQMPVQDVADLKHLLQSIVDGAINDWCKRLCG